MEKFTKTEKQQIRKTTDQPYFQLRNQPIIDTCCVNYRVDPAFDISHRIENLKLKFENSQKNQKINRV